MQMLLCYHFSSFLAQFQTPWSYWVSATNNDHITSTILKLVTSYHRRNMSASTIFVSHLAVADFLILLHLPITIGKRVYKSLIKKVPQDKRLDYGHFSLPRIFCYFESCVKVIVMHVTVFLLCLLAIDRYISIVWNGLTQGNSRQKYHVITGESFRLTLVSDIIISNYLARFNLHRIAKSDLDNIRRRRWPMQCRLG